MTTTDEAFDINTTSAAQAGEKLNWRVIILASLGGALEFYDFIVYGIFAQYIAAAFFPSADPLISLINAFAVFAVGYVSRPLGGLLLGHIGDRHGRRLSFLLSLFVMTLATLGMALMPSYATLGIAASVAFIALRFIQGACLGGELPNAITYVVEAAPRRAGLAGGVVFFCVNTGVFIATGVSSVLHSYLGPAEMQAYGWRIAFGIGALLGFISYLLRTSLEESAAFKQMRKHVVKIPALDVLRRYPVPVLVGIGVTGVISVLNGIMFGAMAPYLTKVLNYDPREAALVLNISIGLSSLGILAVGYASDFIARRHLHRIGAVLIALFSYPAYQALANHAINLYLLFILIGLVAPFIYATYAVMLTDLFPTDVRLSGVAIAYNVSAGVFSGFAPLVVGSLIAATHDPASPGYFLAASAAIAVVAGLFVKRYAVREGALDTGWRR